LVRDDFLGNLTFNVAVKVYKWSSLKPVHEFKVEAKTDSFSSIVVYSHSIPDLLKQSNCVDRTECVVLVEVENTQHNIAVIKSH
jgi:hypothetical protein